GKVQRKVSNCIAGLAAAGSSRRKIAAIPATQASCRDPGTRPELRLPRSQLERVVSAAGIRLDHRNLCDLSKGYFATAFLSSSLTWPARQSGLCGLCPVCRNTRTEQARIAAVPERTSFLRPLDHFAIHLAC